MRTVVETPSKQGASPMACQAVLIQWRRRMFPETRPTLIERLADGGGSGDWSEFLSDYWAPVCRFAGRRAGLRSHEAEDIAADTFEAIIKGRLLSRWSTNRSAKLRTLICSVTNNVISNRARVNSGRERLVAEHPDRFERYLSSTPEGEIEAGEADAFYVAWASSLVQSTVEGLLEEYRASGRPDHFRVLYGKICEGLTIAEIGDALEMPATSVQNCYRRASERLAEKLRETLRAHVLRYCPVDEARPEIELEWERLGEFLTTSGGLEAAVREAYSVLKPEERNGWERRKSLTDLLVK